MASAPAHHDRLLLVDCDVDGMLDLLELALTWAELDYSEQSMVGPERWEEFLTAHRWHDRRRAARVFALANDLALRGDRRAAAASTEPTASVFSALTGQHATLLPEPPKPQPQAALDKTPVTSRRGLLRN